MSINFVLLYEVHGKQLQGVPQDKNASLRSKRLRCKGWNRKAFAMYLLEGFIQTFGEAATELLLSRYLNTAH